MFDTVPASANPVRDTPTFAARRGTVLPRSPSIASESVPPAVWHWLAAALDELDYGIVLVFGEMNVVHINDAARVELDDRHPLQLLGSELCARLGRDVAPLHEAVNAAASRGMRRLLTLGEDPERASVSVIPLEAADAGPRAVLVVLGKRTVCESLSVQGFARSYRLTSAETRVLVALCNGVPPLQAAAQLGVAVVDDSQPDRQHPAQDRRRQHPGPRAPGGGVAARQGRAGHQWQSAGQPAVPWAQADGGLIRRHAGRLAAAPGGPNLRSGFSARA